MAVGCRLMIIGAIPALLLVLVKLPVLAGVPEPSEERAAAFTAANGAVPSGNCEPAL